MKDSELKEGMIVDWRAASSHNEYRGQVVKRFNQLKIQILYCSEPMFNNGYWELYFGDTVDGYHTLYQQPNTTKLSKLINKIYIEEKEKLKKEIQNEK